MLKDSDLRQLSEQVVAALHDRGLTAAFAESCTGGLVTKCITDGSGASAVLPGGVCAYANAVKEQVLGVRHETLESFGAVSHQTAVEMAEGVRRLMGSSIGAGTTGIAGPGSDGTSKPVGLVYVALALPEKKTLWRELHLQGSRDDVRRQTVAELFRTLLAQLTEP